MMEVVLLELLGLFLASADGVTQCTGSSDGLGSHQSWLQVSARGSH